jgi:hypothetical protein
LFRYINLRSLPIFLILVILVIHGVLPAQSSHVTGTPWLSVSGRYIKNPGGNIVILRGVSLVDVSVANSRTRNSDALIDMATDNANGWFARVVRLPVYPDTIDGEPTPIRLYGVLNPAKVIRPRPTPQYRPQPSSPTYPPVRPQPLLLRIP